MLCPYDLLDRQRGFKGIAAFFTGNERPFVFPDTIDEMFQFFLEGIFLFNGNAFPRDFFAFFSVNKKLADKYKMQCWTNAETFDRDMPIRFLPIKFDKLRMKLEAAKRAGFDKGITFEFSHFMSPQSSYLQAGHLYNRYREYFEI